MKSICQPKCASSSKYTDSECKSRVRGSEAIKSTSLSAPDAYSHYNSNSNNSFAEPNRLRPSPITNNHHYFAQSRSHLAVHPTDTVLTTGILRHPSECDFQLREPIPIAVSSTNSSSGCGGSDLKPTAVLVPLEVNQLPGQYFYNPGSPHHTAPVIRFESLHDLASLLH